MYITYISAIFLVTQYGYLIFLKYSSPLLLNKMPKHLNLYEEERVKLKIVLSN